MGLTIRYRVVFGWVRSAVRLYALRIPVSEVGEVCTQSLILKD
jgi:hypothetical protein